MLSSGKFLPVGSFLSYWLGSSSSRYFQKPFFYFRGLIHHAYQWLLDSSSNKSGKDAILFFCWVASLNSDFNNLTSDLLFSTAVCTLTDNTLNNNQRHTLTQKTVFSGQFSGHKRLQQEQNTTHMSNGGSSNQIETRVSKTKRCYFNHGSSSTIDQGF